MPRREEALVAADEPDDDGRQLDGASTGPTFPMKRKKPWKRYKCLKKWGKNADGSCTHLKTQRKCPTSCGVCD